jgi:hypothetical protein
MLYIISTRNHSYIPIKELNRALTESKITTEVVNEIYQENLTNYYNNKLLYHMKYEQWLDFFYLYNTSTTLDHGANIATHIIVAHGYIMAYHNISKANSILANLPDSPAVKLTKSFIDCYEELSNNKMAPNSPDWIVVVSMCAAAALGKKNYNKWEGLENSPRNPWHYELRPWKYPRHAKDIKQDYVFKQRGTK